MQITTQRTISEARYGLPRYRGHGRRVKTPRSLTKGPSRLATAALLKRADRRFSGSPTHAAQILLAEWLEISMRA